MEQERTWEECLQTGEAAIDSDDYTTARKHLLSALELLEDAGEGDLADLVRVTDLLAHAEWFDGDHTAAEESFGRLIVMQEGVFGPNSLEVAETLKSWAQIYIETDDLVRAERLLTRRASILEPRMHQLQIDYAEALDALAHVEHGLGKLGGAIVHVKEAIGIIQAIEGPDSLSLTEPVRTYLLVLQALGAQRHPSPESKAKPKRSNMKHRPEA